MVINILLVCQSELETEQEKLVHIRVLIDTTSRQRQALEQQHRKLTKSLREEKKALTASRDELALHQRTTKVDLVCATLSVYTD